MKIKNIEHESRKLSLDKIKHTIPDIYTSKYEEVFFDYDVLDLREVNIIKEKIVRWRINNRSIRRYSIGTKFAPENATLVRGENLIPHFRDDLLTVCDPKNLTELSILTKGKIFPVKDRRVQEVIKFVITNNLEIQNQIPSIAGKTMKKKTFKEKWFNLPLTNLTEEVKTHCRIVKHRTNLYRDKFVSNHSGPVYPKFSIMGKFLYDPFDFEDRYRNSRKKLVSEFLEDSESKKWLKRKYGRIQEERKKTVRPDKKINKNSFLTIS